MKKQTLFLTLFFLTLVLFQFENELNAQVKQTSGHWYIKAAGWPEYIDNNRVFQNGHVELQVNKRVHTLLETGISAALYKGYEEYTNGFFNFGAVGNWHYLPLFIEKKNLRFEAYLSSKLGLVKYFQTNNNSQSVWARYYFGTGVAYYLTRHLGIYFEYGYDMPFTDPLKLSYYKELCLGVSVKL